MAGDSSSASATFAAARDDSMPKRSFWKGRSVFLTGHTGFKGSWLVLWLERLGAQVTGYALDAPTNPSLYEQGGVAKSVDSVRADIRDFPRLKGAIADCKPDVVLHLAAQSVVRRGYEDPIETYSSNVMGTVNLFEALRQLGHRCVVVNVTSDKCYDNREWVWGYREDEPLGGHDPYANSKGCAELVTSAFRDSYFPPDALSRHGVAIASARAGNAIGGGDWTRDQLIPDLVRSFLDNRPCRIRNPKAIRPWQFVLEPLRGYLKLAERLADDGARFASAWNFGPVDSDARPVAWIADRMASAWGGGARWERDAGEHVHESHYLKLDASKSATYLEWRPLLPLDQGLEWIVEWYRGYQSGADLECLTRKQIERYEAVALTDASPVRP
jgi:CDP-glucose 4,6-dehydratase